MYFKYADVSLITENTALYGRYLCSQKPIFHYCILDIYGMTTGMCTQKYNTKHPNVKIEKILYHYTAVKIFKMCREKKTILLFLIYFSSIMMKL